MCVSLIWFALMIIVGVIANDNNRSIIAWLLISLLITPFVAIIILLIVGKST